MGCNEFNLNGANCSTCLVANNVRKRWNKDKRSENGTGRHENKIPKKKLHVIYK